MTTPDVRVFADDNGLAHGVAEAMTTAIAAAIARRGRCFLALSGGSTPRLLYRTLAGEYGDRIPWGQIDIFWSDERFVPATDERSNYGMAKAELLDRVPVTTNRVHPVLTTRDSARAAADAYQSRLHALLDDPWPRFDLILLGIGEDGHTASLFPHSPALHSRDRLAVAVDPRGDGEPPRVTLTMPVLLAAHNVFVLATGARKAAVIARALVSATLEDCPASALRHSAGAVTWWLDKDAASLIAKN